MVVSKYLLGIAALTFATDCLACESTQDGRLDETIRVLNGGSASDRIEVIHKLTERYRLPGELVIRGVPPIGQAYPTPKIPDSTLVSNVLKLAICDESLPVKNAAVSFLETVLKRTNVLSCFEALVTNSQVEIRLRAAETLIDFSQANKTPLPPSVVPMLAGALADTNTPGELCMTLDCLVRIPKQAEFCKDRVFRLTRHKSAEVKRAARHTLKVIELHSK